MTVEEFLDLIKDSPPDAAIYVQTKNLRFAYVTDAYVDGDGDVILLKD